MTKRIIAFALFIVFSLTSLSLAFAQNNFNDVPITSQYYTAIQYLSSQNIVYGKGDNQFDPDSFITSYQWALMLNRASRPTTINNASTQLTYGQFIESAFHAFDISVYSYELYPNGYHLSAEDNRLRVAKEFGLVGDVKASDYVCRGKAAKILYKLLTHEYKEIEPPLATDWPLVNHEDVWADEYLLQIQRVPEEIQARFKQDGWQYIIDFDYFDELSKVYQVNAIGATSFKEKR